MKFLALLVYQETMDIRKFIKSFSYAIQGIVTALSEQNFRFHLLSTVIVVIAGLLTGLSIMECICEGERQGSGQRQSKRGLAGNSCVAVAR